MAAQPAKFMFDLDLGNVHERTRVVTETGLEDLLRKARDEAYASGKADGENSAVAVSSAQMATAAASLAQAAARMVGSIDTIKTDTRAEATMLATTVGKKLAHQIISQQPLSELEGLIVECLASLDHAPHLVVRCNPDLADQVKEVTESRMKTSGFTGRLVVMGDPDIALGDGRLEWVDGGVVRNKAETERQIDEAIRAWMSANGMSTETFDSTGIPDDAETDQ